MVSTDAHAAGEAVDFTAPPQWVVLSCAGEQLAVPLLRSREIAPPQSFTRLPGCGPEVLGLMNLQGRVVTAFDLGQVLGLESAPRAMDYRVVVIDHEDRVVALVVDAIAGIASEHAHTLPPDAQLGRLEPFRDDVLGVGTLDGRPYLALHVGRVVSRLLA